MDLRGETLEITIEKRGSRFEVVAYSKRADGLKKLLDQIFDDVIIEFPGGRLEL